MIEYHSGDAYANTTSSARYGYYGWNLLPTAGLDGILQHIGAGNAYNTYVGFYNQRMAIQCDYTSSIYGENTGGLDYLVTVVIDLENGTPPSDLKAHLVLTESHIPDSWPNGEVNFVCRAMYPTHSGIDVDFAGGDQVMLEYNFTLDASWVQSNIELIAFVQSNGSQEILQGTMVPINNLPPMQATAGFSCSDQDICAGSSVDFIDESLGELISWEWTFEGGTPATSTEENPTVVYNTPGTYDVELTVYDGTDYSTMLREEYIDVISTPQVPGTPEGETEMCEANTGIIFTTSGATWAETYTWEINPASAGVIMGGTNTATLNLNTGFNGQIDIMVRGNNECGEGEWSEILTGEVYPNPAIFWMSDGSSYCEGGDGVEVSLENSETDIDYELFLDDVSTGTILAGTGSALSFGNQMGPGIYTIIGSTAYCDVIMYGTAYIYPIGEPGQAETPYGSEAVCVGGTNDYATNGAPDAETYVWTLDPPEAGEITGTGVDASVEWSDAYTGAASISVQGINDCGDGILSIPLDVTVEALPEPEVSGEAYVFEYTDHYYSCADHAGSSYEWTVTGGTITSGQGTYEILVSWGGPGSGTVNLLETVEAGCEGEAVEYIVNISPVGIDESFMNDLKLYPNPAGEKLNIELYADKDASIQLQVVSQTGQIVMEVTQELNSGNNKSTLNTSKLSNGYYTLKLIAEDGGVIHQNFVILK